MARKPRINLVGFHHIVNRGVARKITTKEDRNRVILKALDDGYRQSEIVQHLNISCATVSKVFRGVK
ncbi:hypothetical protein MNB_ARC-1_1295 [hydrothermal vent metagenome]|uniref:Resolvase HTH domain-containing protein n=1 Tax=hydrothermal vent metagenome TaxID=652676 RepID=A0A3B1E6J5_9ZZZZ